jgi:replicative DNA helicase
VGLPANVRAERTVLGRILVDGTAYQAVADLLKAEDFSTQAHQILFRRMTALVEGGYLPDRTLVANSLYNCGELEAVGGPSYLAEFDDVPRIGIDGHIAIVKECAVRREAIIRMDAAQKRLSSAGGDGLEIILEIAKDLAGLGSDLAGDSGFVTPDDVIERAGGLANFLLRDEGKGVSLPWSTLNAMLDGLKPAQLIIVAAITSRGKTSFALNVARHVATRETGVAIFSQEVLASDLTQKFLSAETNMDGYQLRQSVSNLATAPLVARGASRVGALPIYIDDRDTATVPAMLARVRKLMRSHAIGLVIVDYLQLVSGTGKPENRQSEVAGISRGLKRMANELKVPVLALSQLNRDASRDNRRPELRDLRESGSIEQDANAVIFLHCTSSWDMPPEVRNPYGEFQCIVAKNRSGSTGDVRMKFNAPTGVFEEVGPECKL